MKKLILSSLFVFNSVVYAQNVNSLDPTQVYTTGNLTTFNQNGSTTTTPWQNVGQWGGSITCWAPGGPGYCGPNPYVGAWGPGSNVINFSYGLTDLHQVVNIANALPNSGTGLRVNGFNFGFMAKNGNGWDNGQKDYLVAYVNFYGADGKLAQNYNYGAYTNQKYNWTQFNFSETFATPYASKDLSTARYGFVGYDSNFWAGPYGPEITNVSFSLKYSVDPCFVNVLSSPSCPGYMDALAKLAPPAMTTNAVTDTNSQNTNTIIQPNSPITQTIIASPSTNTTITPTATASQPTTTASSSREVTNNNGLSIGLGVVARNQQREQIIAMQAAQNAIAMADQTAQQTQQDALSTASSSSTNSLNFANNVRNTPNGSQPTSVSLATQQTQIGLSPISNYGLMPPQPVSTNQPISQQNLTIASVTAQPLSSFSNQSTNTNAVESVSTDSQRFLTDRSSPLYQALENKNLETQNSMTMQQGPVVNKNVQNNELAGGVDIAKMALAPSGYNEYLNLTLRDAAFYAPKEVYRNQRNVDNVRVLRQLSSDRLHQEMIEQQYRR